MRIAILGATGQLGGRTIAHLKTHVRSDTIVAVARAPSKATAIAQAGVEVRQGDYDDRDSLRAAFEGVDTVHLIPSMAMPHERVQQLENAIGAAREAGVRRLVHVGLVGTRLDNPFRIMPYLVYAETALRQSGLAFTLLRNPYYAEPIVEWVSRIIQMGTIPYPTGDGGHPYASRDDLARAAAAVLAARDVHDGELYDLTGPESLTTADLCERVARVSGAEVVPTDATVDDYLQACADDGEPPELSRMLATLYEPVRLGFTSFTTDAIERVTGTPARTFEALLRER